MDHDTLLSTDDQIDEVVDLVTSLGGLVPVADDRAQLVGCVTAAELSAVNVVLG